MRAFTLSIWSTFAWTEKFKNVLCTHFCNYVDLKSGNSSRLINRRCEATLKGTTPCYLSLHDRYVITDPEIGGPVNHCIGLVALLLLRTFSIIAGCGCIRDGVEARGGAFFPIQYLYIYTNPNLFDMVSSLKLRQQKYQKYYQSK